MLLYSAYFHRQVNYPLREEAENQFLQRLEHFFREAGNRCSYQCTQVAERRSEVVGLVLSFGGREEERLNAAIGGWLEREAGDDEWYVDALAVFTRWGRQGIGTRLLQAAEQQGVTTTIPKSRSMSHRRTRRRSPCINVCIIWSPRRPPSITTPMCAWSNDWKTRNRSTKSLERPFREMERAERTSLRAKKRHFASSSLSSCSMNVLALSQRMWHCCDRTSTCEKEPLNRFSTGKRCFPRLLIQRPMVRRLEGNGIG